MLRRVERNVRNLLKLTALSELEISCPLPEGPPLSDWLPLLRKYTGPFHVFLFSATDLRELTTPAVQAIEDAVIEVRFFAARYVVPQVCSSPSVAFRRDRGGRGSRRWI